MPPTDTGLYGQPPAAVLPAPETAIQFSPLIPGSEALETRGDGSLAGMVMLAPPGTIERRYAVAHALRTLAAGASLTLLAPRDKGGTRLAKELAAFGCAVSETSRRHYRICTTATPKTLLGVDEAIADGAPRLVPALGLWSQPGIFGWDRLDPGSALLLPHLSGLSGAGADLGCGIGTLARAVLASPPVQRLSLIDIDRRAIEAARRNIDDARVGFHWTDLRDTRLTLGNLDFVVMNPPFHDGGTEDKALGQLFIQRAAAALRPGGTCWLTANRHLPYEGVMKPLFSRMTLKADASGYKVYEAVK
jgi:16S rRNA (guanine1207-N2)-methyltransferase